MYNAENVLEQVPVEVGVSNGNYVEIKSGLKDSDQVYVEVEVENASSGLSGLMQGLFGGQQMMPGGSGMPSFGTDGAMPNFGGGGSGGGFGGGNSGGGGMPNFGGGGR